MEDNSGCSTSPVTQNDDLTLSQLADQACKHVYIGAAVLPKPLFVLDYDDKDNHDEVSYSQLL